MQVEKLIVYLPPITKTQTTTYYYSLDLILFRVFTQIPYLSINHNTNFNSMQHYSKILSVICAGLLSCAVSATAATEAPDAPSSAVLQAKPAIQVRGVVLDSSGQPIIGATVIEVGAQSNGTLTAADGTFTLSVPSGASLQISYIGYKTATVRAVSGRNIEVVLNEDSELLNDVVVVGYGT